MYTKRFFEVRIYRVDIYIKFRSIVDSQPY